MNPNLQVAWDLFQGTEAAKGVCFVGVTLVAQSGLKRTVVVYGFVLVCVGMNPNLRSADNP